MLYARIDLSKTNYKIFKDFKIFDNPPIDSLRLIYQDYCEYKNFKSVMPIFTEEFFDQKTDVIGYYDTEELVAFSLIKKYKLDNCVDAVQFAWNYKNPKLRLGIESLKNECAFYKSQGFKYLYLGEADEYKKKIDGFEVLGKLK